MNMNLSELINEILSEWAFRVDDGMPNPKNPIHLKELGIVLSEMGLSHIKKDLVENLLTEKGKTPENVKEADKSFTNPILNKKVSYKDKQGNDKEGIVGNLLRQPEGTPARDAAEKVLPPEGSPERDAINQDLGGEGKPQGAEEPKGDKGGAEGGAPKEDPIQKAAPMYDPKADPAMGQRLAKEKETQAQLAKDAEEKDTEADKEIKPKEDTDFNPIPAQDVQNEIPQADPETFGAASDIPDGVDKEDLQKFNTDISKVQKMVDDAIAKGEKAPNINLCQITVPGTNLYCDDNLGIPRSEMPQFKGKAAPGSRAADMPVDKSGEVDTEPVFKEMLKQKNIKVTQTEVPADKLKATQSELVGAKVVGMMGALEENPEHEKITAPIYVSRDGYVIDGHHRWAAVAAYNAKHPEKQIPMKVQVLDQDIKDAIPMANKFAEDMGIAAKKADANKETPDEAPKQVSSLDKTGITDKIKSKIEKWTKEEKEYFEKGYYKAGSEPRRTLSQAIKDKAKGAWKAVKDGMKHEVHEFKSAGQGAAKFFKGEKLNDHEKDALKAVGIKIATTAIFGAAMGGLSHGAAAFGKHVAMEFIPHVVGETILKGAGRAAIFADANGEAEMDANFEKFAEMIADGLENMEISTEQMEAMIDSYEQNKEKKEPEMGQPKIKEELLPLIDELIEGIISDFIKEANPIKKADDVLNQMVKYRDEKGKDHEVKVATALKYKDSKSKGQLQAYKAAAALLKKSGVTDKELGKPKQTVAQDKDVQARVDREKAALAKDKQKKKDVKPTTSNGGSLDSVLGQLPNQKGKEKVDLAKKEILNKIGKIKADDKTKAKLKSLIQNMLDGKNLSEPDKAFLAQWVRIAEPTDKKPNAAKFYIALEQGNFKKREKVETGGRSGSTPMYGAFRQHMENAGMVQIPTSTFGGKKSTANQTFVDKDGKTKLLKDKKGNNIASVQKDKSGNVSGVTIGSMVIKKMDTQEPGISEEERLLRIRNNHNINDYAEKIEKGDMDFIDMDTGVIPDTPQNRVIVINEALGGIAKRYYSLAKKYYVSDKETLALIKRLADFSKKDPNKNPEQWYLELQGIFSDIANHKGEPSLSEGWANFAEVYAAIGEMQDHGKGTKNGKCALLPESTTLETVDVITISAGTNERRVVTLDGRSVKKGVGGASALTSKCNKSSYRNDKDGRIKKGVIEMSESHTQIYDLELDASLKETKDHHTAYRNDLVARAKKLGVSDNFINNVKNRLKKVSKCPVPKGQSEGAGYCSVEAGLQSILEKRQEAGLPVDTNTMAKLRERLESYYYYQFLSHEAYNANVDMQDFSNDSIISQPEDSGGAALARQRRIHINSSNGVSILAYPRPEFNVGFSVDGRSSNPGAGRFHNEQKRIVKK